MGQEKHLAIALVLALVTPALPAAAQDVEFGAPLSAAVPGTSHVVLAEDIDRDGLVDAIVGANTCASFVDCRADLVVVRGRALGPAAPSSLTLGASPTAAATSGFVTDLDGDPWPDVVLGCSLTAAPTGLAVFRGVGPARFAPPTFLPFSVQPYFLFPADLDGNSAPDAIAFANGGSRSTLVGDGFGGFTVFDNASSARPVDVVVADLDGDGLTDAIAIEGDFVQVYAADGSGGLVPRQAIGGLGRPTSLLVADFDRDGDSDVAVTLDERTAAATVVILANDGSGGLAAAGTMSLSRIDELLAAADWNEDGTVDILVTMFGGGVRLFAGDGAGGFAAPTVALTGRTIEQAASGDFDGDGHLDLLVAERDRVDVYRGDGHGSFVAPAREDERVAVPLVLADADSDGRMDAAYASQSPGQFGLALRLGAGDGTFLLPETAVLGARVVGVAAADFDRDGAVDFGASLDQSSTVTVLFGDGTGVPGAKSVRSLTTAPRPGPLLAEDFDGDGAVDLAALTGQGSDLGSVTFLRGDGAGGFSSTTTSAAGASPVEMASGDFDSDGLLDLAIGKYAGGALGVLRGTGSGRFEPAASVPWAGAVPIGLATGDFDGDGHDDVAQAGTARRVRVLFGDGALGFTTRFVDTGRPATTLRAADFDGDGRLDLATLEGDVLLGAAARGFSLHPFSFGEAPLGGDVGDVTGDGLPDVVLSAVVVVENRTLDPVRARRGTVNAAAGPLADVVIVNGSRGAGDRRRVAVAPGAPIELRVEKPPGVRSARAPFVLYEWAAPSTGRTVARLPFALGYEVLPTPIFPGRSPAPVRVWNTIGRFGRLGAPTDAAARAPTVVFSAPAGFVGPAVLTYQGLIVDPAAPNGRAAVTNAVELVVR